MPRRATSVHDDPRKYGLNDEALLRGSGPAWPDIPDPPPPTPEWADAHALTGVWRDSLTMAAGSLTERARRELPPELQLDAPWRPEPEPDSDLDIFQAIAAKVHLSRRMMPIAAEAQLLGVEPALAHVLPWPAPFDDVLAWSVQARLPTTPLFLDLENHDGHPAIWEADTWPLPFHLRGALAWADDAGLCVIPFGSVGGVHLIGGTGYQPWARLIFLRAQPQDDAWPHPGPGDILLAQDGSSVGWVRLDSDSHCAHQASIATNLAVGALSVLMLLDRVGVPLVERPLRRPARRRAKRAGERVGWIPEGMPELREVADDASETAQPPEHDTDACPIAQAHARLHQAHTFWHEALDAYQDPDLFATKLNALLTSLRSVTWVVQKELKHTGGFEEWYGAWQEKMREDRLMRWSLEARNAVEKRGDLDTASVAAVRVTGDWPKSEEVLVDVDADADPAELARRVQLAGGLPERVRREGTLVVERRWTVDELNGQEILDAIAHCFGVLSRLIGDAHDRAQVSLENCALTYEDEHHTVLLALQPSGKPPCMVASRETRTSRRNLSTGAPVLLGLEPIATPTRAQLNQVADHYGLNEQDRIPPDLDPVEQTRRMHMMGRTMLVKDGHHETIVWIARGHQPLGMMVLRPEEQRDKHLMVERLADEITRLGADRVTFAAEIWEAPAVAADDDERAILRAEEREDRSEALITSLLRRGDTAVTFRSKILRDGDALTLSEPHLLPGPEPPFLAPIHAAWAEWPD